MTPLKKMTIKTCGDFTSQKLRGLLLALGPIQKDPDGKEKQVYPEDGTALPIIKIAGEASGAESGETPLGAYTLLQGQFVGTDLTTGELYSAKKCILPDYIGSELGDALLNAGAEGQSVQFAFEIVVKQKASSVTGYEYGIKSLMAIEPTDTAKRLLQLAGITVPVKQLAAPAPAEPPAAVPAEPVAAKQAAKPGKK
jgi:hypothetical protein